MAASPGARRTSRAPKATPAPRVVLASSDPQLRILVRRRYPAVVVEPPGRWSGIAADDVVLVDTSGLSAPAEPGSDGQPPAVRRVENVLHDAPRCRVFLLTADAGLDLATCRALAQRLTPHGPVLADYLPRGFAFLADLPDVSASDYPTVQAAPGEEPAQTAWMLRLAWLKLRAYLVYRASLSDDGRTGVPSAEGLDAPVVGNLLEDVAYFLLGMVPGFHPRKGAPSPLGQIDLVVRNESPHPFWAHLGPFFAVECKNRGANPGGDVVDKLTSFARRRTGLVRFVLVFHTAARFAVSAQRRALADGQGGVALLELNRPRLLALLEDAPFADARALAHHVDSGLREAVTRHVFADDPDR